jgi:hypothetical protein
METIFLGDFDWTLQPVDATPISPNFYSELSASSEMFDGDMAYADEWLKFTTPDVVPTPSETEPQAMPESMNIEYIHIDVPDGFVPIGALTQGLPGNPSMPELLVVPDQSVRAKKPFQYGPDDIFMKALLYLVEIPNSYASYPTVVKWTISPFAETEENLIISPAACRDNDDIAQVDKLLATLPDDADAKNCLWLPNKTDYTMIPIPFSKKPWVPKVEPDWNTCCDIRKQPQVPTDQLPPPPPEIQ